METKTHGRGRAANRCPTQIGSHCRARRYALGLAVIAIAACGPSAFAEIYDDFNDATRSATLWSKFCFFGTCTQTVTNETGTNGYARLGVTPPGAHGNSILRSTRTWALREGRTLEFRVDLLSSNADGAVAYFGFLLDDWTKGYLPMVDKDTIALVKATDPLQLFYLTNGTPVKVSNVKLVLSLTGVTNSVHLKFKILDNDHAGAVIFQREWWDTPAADPLQVGTDAPPGNYLGQRGYFEVAVYHDNAQLLDPVVELDPRAEAVVVFDNAEVFEYDAPVEKATRSVLISWPENTAEEQIVLASDSLASNAVWTPWPEPIFKRFGELCMAVPINTNQNAQYFKLVPGTQFIDDFSDAPQWPYATRGDWVPYFFNTGDASRFTFAITNGACRIRLAGAVDGHVVIAPPGPLPVLGDFTASVDILNCAANGWSGVAIFARGHIHIPFPGDSNSYLGQFNLNPSQLAMWLGDQSVAGPPFTYDPAASYRLQFSGVGTTLKLRIVNLTTGQTIEQPPVTGTMFSQGYVALGLLVTPGTSYDVTLDNFFVTGTKP